MKIKFSTSMMCAGYSNLISVVETIDSVGVNFLHVDIMDGHYVPNITIGPDYVKELREISSTKLDIHLMVEKPENFIEMFDLQPMERVSFHADSTYHPHRLISKIKEKGLEVGIAIGPAMSICSIEELLADLDFIQVMTINPGFAGKTIIPGTIKKIRKLKNLLDKKNIKIDIQVDGAVSFDNLLKLIEVGGNLFVLGYAACFNEDITIKEGLIRLKSMVINAGYEVE